MKKADGGHRLITYVGFDRTDLQATVASCGFSEKLPMQSQEQQVTALPRDAAEADLHLAGAPGK